MGGKSVVMKTVALNVLLLQAGFLVCAKKARMPLFYSVKMLFDDLQSIQSGLSGFGSEIVQFRRRWRRWSRATPCSCWMSSHGAPTLTRAPSSCRQ